MMVPSRLPADEPLAELAAFAFDWAHCLCDPVAGCFTYHRAWSMVRHIETGGALPLGLEFFGNALRGLARDGRIRVLLSGAADTGLAAMVLQGLRPHGIEPELILVDRCATTLEQNRLFARHAGFPLQTFHMDAAALSVAPVDAIVVHSFLGLIAVDARQSVVDMWARNLAPHGQILMSNRLSVGKGAIRPPVGASTLAQRKTMIAAKAAALGNSPARTAAIADAAEALWSIRKLSPQLGEPELLDLLANARLKVVRIDRDSSGHSVSPAIMDADARRRDRAEMIVVHAV